MNVMVRFLQKDLAAKAALIGLLCLYMGLALGGYWLVENTTLFNGITLLLVLVIGSIVSITLWRAEGRLFSQVAMVAVIYLVYLFPRTLSYAFLPDTVAFPFDLTLAVQHVNQGLLYVLYGTVGLIMGIIVADRMFQRMFSVSSSPVAESEPIPISVLLSCFLIVIALDWFITDWLGVSHFKRIRADTWNAQIQIAKALFSADMAILLVLTGLVLQKRNDVRTYIWMAMVGVGYISFAAYNGSRSAGLSVLMMFLVIGLTRWSNFRLTIREFMAVFLFFSVITWFVYPIATQARITDSMEFKIKHDQANPGDPIPRVDGVGLYHDIRRQFGAVSNRLGASLLDPIIVVLSHPGNFEAKSKYMTLDYAARSIMNFCVPGIIFPEAELSTSRVMQIIYGGMTEEYVKSHGYFSQIWTGWALGYLVFGTVGGIVVLSSCGFLLHLGYLFIGHFSLKSGAYLEAGYLFLMPQVLMLSSGIDHTVTTIMVRFIQMASFLLMCYAAIFVIKRTRERWRVGIQPTL